MSALGRAGAETAAEFDWWRRQFGLPMVMIISLQLCSCVWMVALGQWAGATLAILTVSTTIMAAFMRQLGRRLSALESVVWSRLCVRRIDPMDRESEENH